MNASPLWLVLNPASGSNSPKARDTLEQALAAAGASPARIIRCPDDDLPTRASLEAAGVATLAIFTGDGTINAAVERLHGWAGAVLVLPGGTQNLLAKALHGEADPADIVARLAAGTLEPALRPAVRTSRGHALVEVVAGPGAMWADVREGLRDQSLRTIAGALTEAVRETVVGAPVHVAQPPLGRPEGYRALRIDANAATLTIDGYDAEDLSDLAAHASQMIIRRDFRAGPHQRLGQADAITCRSDQPMALMLDGERFDGTTREDLACVTLPVRFLHSPGHAAG
ncbi:MAG: hypothetical protein RIS94_2377 [Pseudomonadota bacterium]|jgi:diacylglycerol kinase family enzyme